jgi:hypothetical protein
MLNKRYTATAALTQADWGLTLNLQPGHGYSLLEQAHERLKLCLMTEALGDRSIDRGEGASSSSINPRCWERPRILSREPLEAVAAVCAPAGVAKGNPGLCPQGPISS